MKCTLVPLKQFTYPLRWDDINATQDAQESEAFIEVIFIEPPVIFPDPK